MNLKDQINQDLKAAMLAGDKTLTTTLRGLKSAILYAEVAAGERDQGLSDEAIQKVLAKEAKQRQESADMYTQGGNPDKAEAELVEKQVIEKYLPEQASQEDIARAVDEVIKETGVSGPQAMGQVIGAVKQRLGAGADGAIIAKITKEKLS